MDINSRFRLHATLSPRLSGGDNGYALSKYKESSQKKFASDLHEETKGIVSTPSASISDTATKTE